VTTLPSHSDDRAAEATWPRHNNDVESCWRWYGVAAEVILGIANVYNK
jgi:hypothetical protein